MHGMNGLSGTFIDLHNSHSVVRFAHRTAHIGVLVCGGGKWGGDGRQVGPEGPTIHIGAMMALVVLEATNVVCFGRQEGASIRSLCNDSDRRLFMAAGAAAGIACAFRAPIGERRSV